MGEKGRVGKRLVIRKGASRCFNNRIIAQKREGEKEKFFIILKLYGKICLNPKKKE